MAGTTTEGQTGMKTQYLNALEREVATTLKVLRAYPAEQSELRPHARCKTARELSWIFAMEMGAATAAITDTLTMPPQIPPPPETLAECIAAFEGAAANLSGIVDGKTDEELRDGTVHFLVAPHTMGDIPKIDFLWFMLHDMIHHRGQFSIYLRMADGKVPSIYGPSGDEPWF